MTKVSKNNTKAQILEAYEDLLKKVEEKSNDNPKEVQKREEKKEVLKKAADSTEHNIAEQIHKIKSEFVGSLDKIEKELASERKKLEVLQEAIKIEDEHLKSLYGLTSNADSLAAILLAQKEQKETFQQEMKARKEALDQEIRQTKLKWEKEKKEHDESLKAEREQTKKMRKREEDEYEYALQQKRMKEKDDFELRKVRLEADLKEKQDTFNKTFAEREKNIKEKETELKTLQDQVTKFPKQLEQAVAKAVKETEEKLKFDFKYKTDIKEKENQGIINLKELQIKSLEQKIKEMEVQLKEASQKAEVSEKSVKDIALKAIESAGKIQVFEKEKSKGEV